MSYRFLKIQTVESIYLKPFFKAHPEYKYLSYEQLFDLYMKKCCGWNTHYSTGLGSLGNEAWDICVNFEFLQKLWAKENGVKYTGRDWLKEILAAQLNLLRPDVLLLDDLYVLDAGFRQYLRENSPKPIKILGWRAAPTEDYSVFNDIDLMLTCTPLFARRMQEQGANVELLMHAFEPTVLDLLGPYPKRDIDFSFIGSVVLRNGFHRERFTLVKKLMERTNLELWGSFGETIPPSLKKRLAIKFGSGIDKAFRMVGLQDKAMATSFASNKPGPITTEMMRTFHDRIHEPVFALEYFRVLSRSKLTLNKHIDCAEEYAGNIRLFEGTGLGACLVTDWKVNLREMFEPDVEVVTYKTVEECVEKVRYLLDHESESRNIGMAGQRRTLRDHTFQNRAEQLNEIIRNLLARGGSNHSQRSLASTSY